jgi:hypothetical protein
MPKFRMPTLTMTTDIVIFTIRDERLEILSASVRIGTTFSA